MKQNGDGPMTSLKGKKRMLAVIVLLALSAVTGFALGSFSWFAI
jgi:hypothetical protein